MIILEQLSLRYGYTQEYLEGLLSRACGKAVSLKLTENTSRMVSVSTDGCAASVRVHRIFLEAEADVVRELALFVKKRNVKTPLINRFITQKSVELRNLPRRRPMVKTSGRYCDLMRVYESVNAEYFGGLIDAAITWGRAGRRGVVRRRTLGSYSFNTNMIRINPALDRKDVPEYYIGFIVYHEMLHACLGMDKSGARRSIHPRRFREMERLFKDYRKAVDWERARGV